MDEQTETSKMFERLREPMPHKWRLKSVADKKTKPYPEGTRGQFIAYIDARAVFDRLDDVLGPECWQDEVSEPHADGSLRVTLSLFINGDWISKTDIGYSNNPGSDKEEEPLKAAVSDGVKRAAIHWGVGRFLYAIPPVWTAIDQWGEPVKPIDPNAPSQRPAPSPALRVDPETGEILDEPVDRPCGIAGCTYECKDQYVDYSVKKFGVPLCGKHSNLAKAGDAATMKAIANANAQIEIERADDARSLGNRPVAAREAIREELAQPRDPWIFALDEQGLPVLPDDADGQDKFWNNRLRNSFKSGNDAYQKVRADWIGRGLKSAFIDALVETFDIINDGMN